MPRPHYNKLVLTLIVDLSATEIDSAGYISLYLEKKLVMLKYRRDRIGIRAHTDINCN